MASKLLFSLVVGALCLGTGCSSSGSPTGRQAADSADLTTLMAFDTSGSAVEYHAKMFKRASQEIQNLPENKYLYLYRFDSAPAEVFSEPPPAGMEDISKLLNGLLKHRSATDGTNIAKLIVAMDKRLAELTEKVNVVIFTDCGTEAMSTLDCEYAKRITERWGKKELVKSVKIVGVADGHREKLRELILVGPGVLSILSLDR